MYLEQIVTYFGIKRNLLVIEIVLYFSCIRLGLLAYLKANSHLGSHIYSLSRLGSTMDSKKTLLDLIFLTH